jgi:hypothetical protein
MTFRAFPSLSGPISKLHTTSVQPVFLNFGEGNSMVLVSLEATSLFEEGNALWDGTCLSPIFNLPVTSVNLQPSKTKSGSQNPLQANWLFEGAMDYQTDLSFLGF